MVKIIPLSNRVLIKPILKESKTKSGIIIPDTVEKEKPQEGNVIAVGKGKTLENGIIQKPSVKKGDRVLFKKYGPAEIKIDGIEYMIAEEEDILAIIE